MNDPELYQKSNSIQKRDALQCLEEYAMKIKWKKFGDRVIDIGCGDGSVTTEILRKFMPRNFKKLVGCDVSEKMVHFANEHYGDEQTAFTVLDIEGELPQDLRGNFDHAFSFYTLHWIKRQEIAFSNIYGSLAEGGDCLLMFLGHTPVFDVYRVLSRNNKWSSWIKDVDRYVSPYHDSQEPEKEIKKMMVKIGFHSIEIKCVEKSCAFDKDDLKKVIMAINPFNIPKRFHDQYIEDYLEVVKETILMDKVNNNINKKIDIKSNYDLIVVYARK